MFRRPEYASRHASAPKCHFVLEVLYGVFVPAQGLFEIRQLDRYGIRTVRPRAGCWGNGGERNDTVLVQIGLSER